MPNIQPVATAVQSAAQSASSAAAGANLTAIQVAIADLSQAFESLSHAIQTQATVTAPPANNTVTLSTQLGSVTVSLPQQLSAAEQQSLIQQLMNLAQSGQSFTLGLAPGSPPTQAVLLLPATTTTPLQQNPNGQAPNLALSFPPLTAGEEVAAIVLPSDIPLPPATQILTPQPAPIPLASVPASGASVDSSIISDQAIQVEPSSALPAQTSGTPPQPSVPLAAAQAPAVTVQILVQAPEEAVPPPPSAPPPPTPSLAALLQPGNEITLHIDAVLPPSSTPPALPSLAPHQMAAIVTGTGTDGQLILKSGDATLFVKAQVTTPIGSTVILTASALKATPLVTFPSIDPLTFPALPQAMAVLAQIDPQIFQQILATRIPQPSETLPGAMLFLFSAFKQGSLRDWLGDDATESLLRAGKMDLVDSLSRELSGAGQPAQDAVVGEWRSYPIPLYTQQHFHSLMLHVHNDREGRGSPKDSQENGPGKVRFLIDMQLSKLGAMQIDGFFQPKKLDMVLRSENTLPPGMHHDLRAAYIKAIGAVGYAGSLHFQVGRKHWLVMRRAEGAAILT